MPLSRGLNPTHPKLRQVYAELSYIYPVKTNIK